jgi:Branched-chain amino acid transport system / permease component
MAFSEQMRWRAVVRPSSRCDKPLTCAARVSGQWKSTASARKQGPRRSLTAVLPRSKHRRPSQSKSREPQRGLRSEIKNNIGFDALSRDRLRHSRRSQCCHLLGGPWRGDGDPIDPNDLRSIDLYGIGNSERAIDLSGVNTRRVVMLAFAIAGGTSAFGGVLLAGYASKAAQAMGDAYLLPSIAAVVLGGTSILGGKGNYLGTVAGAILVTLLQSILSVMQIPEFGRQIVYGVVIVAMLLLYGREKLQR